MTVEQVIQKQLEAYNARDVEALLSLYAPDAQMFKHPSRLLASGAAELRDRFVLRFQEPDLHARLLQRIIMGNTVVDHEEVTRTFPEGKGKIELIMIYLVQNQRITSAWVLSGPQLPSKPAGS